MIVDYNKFSKTFAKSRKNMKWEELNYFFSFLSGKESLLDIGCGSGRLLSCYNDFFGFFPSSYIGIDTSHELLAEAIRDFPNFSFYESEMQSLKKCTSSSSIDTIFSIASFHHLSNFEERIQTLEGFYDVLTDGGKVYMTNWDLQSPLNIEKYYSSIIIGSQNQFGSQDFSIKIGNHTRFYHSFHTSELQALAFKAGFTILENRLFESQRNTITILSK